MSHTNTTMKARPSDTADWTLWCWLWTHCSLFSVHVHKQECMYDFCLLWEFRKQLSGVLPLKPAYTGFIVELKPDVASEQWFLTGVATSVIFYQPRPAKSINFNVQYKHYAVWPCLSIFNITQYLLIIRLEMNSWSVVHHAQPCDPLLKVPQTTGWEPLL